ncbi:MAG: HAD family hydrolase [Thiotrichales bacterium]
MRKRKHYDVLIFDWDGTLMDSESHIVSCLARSLASVGAEPQPDDVLKQVIGLGLNEAMRQLLPDVENAVIEQTAEAYRAQFFAKDSGGSTLFPGAIEVLEQCRAAGFLLAVATGKSRRGLDKVLDETGLNDYFAITRCASETFSKPHPLMLEEILVDLDTPASRAVMIGDTEFDLQMAGSINMPSIGVSYGVHEVERLLPHRPMAVLDAISELTSWMDSE